MPELSFRLRWPDASETVNYSPSTIVGDFFTPGVSYEIGEFMRRSRLAMQAASARVEQKYGFPCARAQATLAAIEARATAFAGREGALVTVLAVTP